MLNPTNFTQDPSDLIEIRVQNQVQGRPKSDKRCTMTFGMHAAAKKGKVEELKSLLEKGDPWQRDDKNRTPLHYACEYGQQAVAYKMAKVILNCRQVAKATNKTKRKLVDCQDPAGDTALHIAARIGHPDVVDLLLCEGADVDIKNRKDEKQLELIYKTVPSTMTAEYDYSVSCKKGDLIDNDQNLTLDIDFGAICGIPNPKPGPDSDSPLKFHPETKWLYDCLGLSLKKQQVILMHPVVQLFLHLKWKKIRILLWLSILYHIFWLILYTAFNVNLYSFSCPYHNRSSTRHTVTATPFTKTTITFCEDWSNYGRPVLNFVFLLLMTLSIIGKEIYEIYQCSKKALYFQQLENIGQLLVVGIVFLTSLPLFQVNDAGEMIIYQWQYQAAAFGVMLSCCLSLSQIGKIPRFGIYMLILGKVVRSFAMFMATFAAILVAFMLSFQILMPEKAEFNDNPWGFIRVMSMMSGEINYDSLFYSDPNHIQLPFPISTKLLFAAFIAIVTIILCNLLIGLTVNDIQGLQSEAAVRSLSIQVDEINLMESFLMSDNVQELFKTYGQHSWLRYFLVTQQQHDDPEKITKIKVSIKEIPKDLRSELKRLAEENLDSEDDDEDGDSEDDEDTTDSCNSSTTDSCDDDDDDATELEPLSKASIQTVKVLKRRINAMLEDFVDQVKTQEKNQGSL